MSEYVLGWGSLAFINAALASIDRRSPLKYLLASLFMGPLLTVFIASTWEESDGSLRQVDLWKGRRASNRQSGPAKSDG
jgi:hypothetical protein